MHFIRALALAAACTTSACSTFDFDTVRKPDGTYDIQRLIAELEKSGRNSVDDGTWIPLIHTDFLTFEKSGPGLPPGYTFAHLKGYGPLFLAGTIDRQVVTPKGEAIEWSDREWFGWGLLWSDRDDYTTTPFGTRHEKHERFVVLFGPNDVTYTPTK